MSLKIGEGLLAQSLAHLRDCGQGKRECVVLWLVDAEEPERVTRVVHPDHHAHRGGYRIDGDWLDRLWDELAEREERIVAQVHTHPREAFHSRTDDAYPILTRPGLYSIVIPRFAQAPIDQSAWFLARLREDGSWMTLDYAEAIR